MKNLSTARKLIEGLNKSERDLWVSVLECQSLVHSMLVDKFKQTAQAIAAPTTAK